MTTRTYAGQEVELDAEGFFVDPRQWTEGMADEIAGDQGLHELTDRHREVVKFMRHEYEEKGDAPNVRALSKSSGVSIKELYQLFPGGPAKSAAKIAGIPKPSGCI